MPEIQSIAGALFGLSFSAWVLLELEDMQFTSTESEYVFLHSKFFMHMHMWMQFDVRCLVCYYLCSRHRWYYLVRLTFSLLCGDCKCIGTTVLQRYMDSEIRAIMAQYMPLDNQGEIPSHVSRGDIWNRKGETLVWYNTFESKGKTFNRIVKSRSCPSSRQQQLILLSRLMECNIVVVSMCLAALRLAFV